MSNIKISIESWEPEYGSPILEPGLEPSKAAVDLEVERKLADWSPISPDDMSKQRVTVYFIDGVRRIEALVWIAEKGQIPRRGICASFAAGIVKSSERAELIQWKVRRALFSSASISPFLTKAGTFEPIAVASQEMEHLIVGLQQSLGSLEVEIASSLALEENALVIIDGPLSGHKKVPGAIGYIKTHQVAYLPEPQSRILSELKPGQRTPIFLSTTSWTRYSWYLKLPGPAAHTLSGIVRLEAAGELKFPTVQQLANLSSSILPAYASTPHKDPRAPQNLFPIGGLERELRRRLGDRNIVQRALKVAAANS